MERMTAEQTALSLHFILQTAAKIDRGDGDRQDGGDLAAMILELDEHLSHGAPLPAAWANGARR